jgi:glutathione synthase
MLAAGSEKLERTRDGHVVYIGAARLEPALRERGLLFVGIDVIDGFLTEINVTSPTGIRAVKNVGGPDIAALVWDAIEAKRS